MAIKIKKYSGALVDFNLEKLKVSLRNAHASELLIETITKQVQRNIFDGITTRKIYQMAFKLLKAKTQTSASRYQLKKAIMELGPSGFPFEKFVGKIIESEGYNIQVGVTLQGKCVSHEVDVVAKNTKTYMLVECKYHNTPGRVNDVKIPLYIHSRFRDIQNNRTDKNTYLNDLGFIYTNTRFTKDAIAYAECAGLKLISWDYPENNSLKNKINKYHLYPVTALTVLTKKDKMKLLDYGIVLCKEIHENPKVLFDVGIEQRKHKKIIENAKCL